MIEDADPFLGDLASLGVDIRLKPGLRLGPSRSQLFGRVGLPEGAAVRRQVLSMTTTQTLVKAIP
ncbi:MAG: hypothetical protein K5905_24295 [Roseibium sp.]|uniref:hypothetical protein n=1 Tax=Roseibium sp. TaxID=1936156 RepID=UPI00261A8DD5|nr:hypothetical protein [Roseibium sp.]MCV0428590.1 hypothetical protein [Roseibium sp.]